MTSTADEGREPDETVDGAFLAAEVASLVTATVAFALWLDGSTVVLVPGGSLSAFAAAVLFLGVSAVAAAAKARHRGQEMRSHGHVVLASGLGIVAIAGGVVLVDLGGIAVTGATLGVVVAVAGLNLVALDVVR
jgi:hypothetical protein